MSSSEGSTTKFFLVDSTVYPELRACLQRVAWSYAGRFSSSAMFCKVDKGYTAIRASSTYKEVFLNVFKFADVTLLFW